MKCSISPQADRFTARYGSQLPSGSVTALGQHRCHARTKSLGLLNAVHAVSYGTRCTQKLLRDFFLAQVIVSGPYSRWKPAGRPTRADGSHPPPPSKTPPYAPLLSSSIISTKVRGARSARFLCMTALHLGPSGVHILLAQLPSTPSYRFAPGRRRPRLLSRVPPCTHGGRLFRGPIPSTVLPFEHSPFQFCQIRHAQNKRIPRTRKGCRRYCSLNRTILRRVFVSKVRRRCTVS